MTELPLEVSCADAHERLQSSDPPLLIDCREPEEHALVHIVGCKLFPMSEIQQRLEQLRELDSGNILVYCHHGMRSAQVANWLRTVGIENAQSISGGIDVWAQDIDPNLPRY